MAIQDYCIGLKGAVNAIHRVTRALSGNVDSTTISDAVEEVAIAIENGGGGGGGGTTDHTKLQNRDSADQHPISAITGLEIELNGKASASSTYTKSEVDSSLATKQEKLQSGTNIKSINGNSVLGSGNLEIDNGVFHAYSSGEHVTSFNDLATAVDSNKIIIVDDRYVCTDVRHTDTFVLLSTILEYDDGFFVRQYYLYDRNVWNSFDHMLQDELVSGTNIKTINNKSIVGSGNIEIQGGGMDFEVGVEKPYGTFTDDGTTYQVYSKVIYISALPSASGITNYPHGVTNIKQVLSMYGICTNGMVMNTPRQTTSDNIGIYQVQKSGNFAIEVGKDRSSIGAYVTMIYAKNN